MGIIKDKEKKKIKKVFKDLKNPVKLVFFTQDIECNYCSLARELVEDIAGLSDKLSLETRDFVADKERAGKYGIDKIPAIIIEGERDYGIRFYGIPGGYEFTTFIEDIIMVSAGDHGLDAKVVDLLSGIDKPVHIQVMTMLTCPVCPAVVRTAHRFAMASEQVRADMIDVSEFPHLAVKYHVHGVPKTVINEDHSFVGALSEENMAREVLKALGK